MKNDTLQTLRLKNNLTRNDVAKSIGVTVTYVYMLENGDRKPSDDLKIKLARLYECSIEDIFMAIILTRSLKK